MMKGVKWRVKAILEYARFQRKIFAATRAAHAQEAHGRQRSVPLCFVAGCGRSGTTLLGRLLSLHPDIVYLNEPRPYWITVSKRTEIWGYCRSEEKQRSLLIGDPLPEEAARFAALFFAAGSGSRLLVEKTPENVFRLPWLHALAPDAKLIYIVRNGYDVIRSILVEADFDIPYGFRDMNNWYGTRDKKKRLLAQTAREFGIAPQVVDSCTTSPDWAALEWVCSNRAFERHKQYFIGPGLFEVRYEELTTETWEIYSKLLGFLNLSATKDLQGEIMGYVRPGRPSAPKAELAPGIRELFESEQIRLGYL